MDASSVILNYSNPSISSQVYVNTNVGGWFFDAVVNTDYSRELYITENPVETGADLSDFAYLKPVKLVMQIKMSDVATSRIQGQFTGGKTRSLQAFQVLATLQGNKIPVNVMTRIGGFKNMLVQSISIPDDIKTQNGLMCTVILQEIFVAQTKTVKISANKQVTDSTNKGTPDVTPIDGSLLYQGLVNFFGKTETDAIVGGIGKTLNGK